MLKLILSLLIVCATFLQVGAKNVIAKFKCSVSQTDSTIEITNQSTKNASSYSINFGDGAIFIDASHKDYTHKYAAPGTFHVCLTVIDSVKNDVQSDSHCEEITIKEATLCNANFDYSVSGLSVIVVDKSVGNNYKIIWTLGNGKKGTNKATTDVTYNVPGIYEIGLSITNKKEICESNISKTIVIAGDTNNCIASFTYNFITSKKLQFNNTSIGQYDMLLWSFGNGRNSKETNPFYEYAHPGKYTVSLVVRSKANKVKTSYSEQIIVEPDSIELLPDFEAITYPDSLSASFNSLSIGSGIKKFTWSFGDGVVANGNTASHIYNKPGDYNVCLMVTPNKGKSASACKNITVGTYISLKPQFTYILNDNQEIGFLSYLSIKPDSLRWDFGDGSSSLDTQPIHTFHEKGIYLARLKIKFQNIYSERLQIINLTDNPTKLIGRFMPEKENSGMRLKAGSKTVRYKGSLSGDVSRIRFEWDFGDGDSDTLNLETEHTYAEDGVYNVCYTVYNDLTGDYDQQCQQVAVGEVTQIISPNKNDDNYLSVWQAKGYINVVIDNELHSYASVNLYDISGRMVSTIFNGNINPGPNAFRIETPKEKGIYIVRYLSAVAFDYKKLIIN